MKFNNYTLDELERLARGVDSSQRRAMNIPYKFPDGSSIDQWDVYIQRGTQWFGYADDYNQRDAEFVAAVSDPATIFALIDHIRDLEELIKR